VAVARVRTLLQILPSCAVVVVVLARIPRQTVPLEVWAEVVGEVILILTVIQNYPRIAQAVIW